jgi:prenyltransferase/squalene oxidase-like repeat protein
LQWARNLPSAESSRIRASPGPQTMAVNARLEKFLTGPGSDPSVRARYWIEVKGRSRKEARVQKALKTIGRTGWAANLLEHQFPDGHWATPGASARELYRPKYIVTNWRAIVLADLGMTRSDPRVQKTAELILTKWGEKELVQKDAELCITGNAARTLIRFGYLDHPVVQKSIAWLVRTQKADGGWHCFRSRTGTLDCWEGLQALAEIPEEARDAAVRRSIERGAEFYLKHRLMTEGRVRYPPWFRIHYPNHYYYDLLIGLRILSRLGYGADPRMAPAVRWLREKRRPDGTWALDADHPDLEADRGGYTFTNVVYPMRLEPPGVPSRWATVEALSILSRIGSS